MSAFYVGAEHVNAMLCIIRAMSVTHALDTEFTDAEMTAIGKLLLAENIKSLKRRYPDDWFTMIPEDLNKFQFHYEPAIVANLKTEDFRMLFVCYRYQSCEHPGWETSYAARFANLGALLLDNGKASNVWHYRHELLEQRA
jgi:hypothetical protein